MTKHNDVITYIKNQREKGVADASIKHNLQTAGWNQHAIDKSFSKLTPETAQDNSTITEVESLPSLSLLIRKTLRLYVQNLKVILLLCLIPYVLTFLLNIADFQLGWGYNLYRLVLEPSWIILVIGYFLIVAFSWIIIQLFIVVTLQKDNDKTLNRTFSRGFSTLGSFVVTYLLMIMIIVGGLIPLIIPALLFSVWFRFAPFISIFEDRSGLDALTRSRQYVQGNFAEVLYRIVLFVIIIVVANTALDFLLGQTISILLETGHFRITTLLTVISNWIPGILFVPLLIIFDYLLYTELYRKPSTTSPISLRKQTKYLMIWGIAVTVVACLAAATFFYLSFTQIAISA